MTQNRTVDQKAADAVRAYKLLREEVSQPELRAMFTKTMETANGALAEYDPASEVAAAKALATYHALVQDAILIGRQLAANDRAAMMAAAVITQSGVSRPVIVDEE